MLKKLCIVATVAASLFIVGCTMGVNEPSQFSADNPSSNHTALSVEPYFDNYPRSGYPFRIYNWESKQSLDAYQDSKDHKVVTRNLQTDDTQRWLLDQEAVVYKVKQKSSGRFMDAYENNNNGNDYSAVTRKNQNNDTQYWLVQYDYPGYRILQISNDRYLDAHEKSDKDYSVVTRTEQDNESQHWNLTIVDESNHHYRIQQVNTQRYLDAHEKSSKDWNIVTRDYQNNDTQIWELTEVGRVYTVKQKSSSRFLDAYTSDKFKAVTRTAQDNNTQRWLLMFECPIDLYENCYKIRQMENKRYLKDPSDVDYVKTTSAGDKDNHFWVFSPNE